MVTEAGKELLRNTINTAKFHNKILEENEMWKQWEIERGLTMMVSDDDVLKRIRKHHRCAKHRQIEDSRDWSRSQIATDSAAGTSSSDRWDHSGFQELYPNEPLDRPPVSSRLKEVSKKWDHSGYQELYRDETVKKRTDKTPLKKCFERWGHDGFKELYPDEQTEKRKKSSCSKIHCKRHKEKKVKKIQSSDSSTSDDEIYKEFKEYKRKRKLEKEMEKIKNSKRRSTKYDSHVKEWKRHKEKLH